MNRIFLKTTCCGPQGSFLGEREYAVPDQVPADLAQQLVDGGYAVPVEQPEPEPEPAAEAAPAEPEPVVETAVAPAAPENAAVRTEAPPAAAAGPASRKRKAAGEK